MNSDDESDYWVPAAMKLFGGIEGIGKYLEESALEKVLGTTIWSQWRGRPFSQDYPLTEEWRQLLRQLAGPYGKAILRAYQIKHGVEPNDT